MGNIPIGVANEKPKIYAMHIYLTDLVFYFATSHDIRSWRFDNVVYVVPGENVRSEEDMNQKH
jgi:hypothetical protein